MTDELIPTTYDSWRHCITEKCGLALTPDYIAQRIAALNNAKDPHTQQLRRLYGEPHHRNLLAWFDRAQRNAVATS